MKAWSVEFYQTELVCKHVNHRELTCVRNYFPTSSKHGWSINQGIAEKDDQ